MKKSLLLCGALFLGTSAFSQTIFSENFNAATTLPTGWAQYNVDGLTPATNMAFMGTNAWVGYLSTDATQGNMMTSTSWYTPAGTSNDWLVTPAIVIPATGSFQLNFDIQGQDPQFLDSYEVYISTAGNTVASFTGTPAIAATSTAVWENKAVDLTPFLGQTIYVAFRNNSNDKFRLNLDNVKVRTVLPVDALLNSVDLVRYAAINTNNILKASVTNNGSTAITSLTINWNDGVDHSSVITTSIAAGQTAIVNHPTSLNYATAVEKNVAVNITNVNGGTDGDMTNNSGAAKINTLSQLPQKAVVIEEGTGTWCQWCPRGAVAMDYMYSNYSKFIGIAVHNADPMALAEYDAAADFSGYPASNVDRVILDGTVSTQAFETYYNQRKDLIVPAAISATLAISGSNVTINAKATFKTPISNANFRLAVVIMENNVTGTGPGYNQKNAYAGGANGPMGGYESLPATVPAAQMVYNHVGRALLGGYNGQTGSVPAAVVDGTEAAYTFNYTVPATSNRPNMTAVVMLIDQNTGEIINAYATALSSLGASTLTESINMNVYPNPTSENVKVAFEATGNDYSISIYDLQGKVVKNQDYKNLNGAQTIELGVSDLSAGTYLISVATEGSSFTQQVIVK
jgi:hypothetical protein